jgi:hypothetical protein
MHSFHPFSSLIVTMSPQNFLTSILFYIISSNGLYHAFQICTYCTYAHAHLSWYHNIIKFCIPQSCELAVIHIYLFLRFYLLFINLIQLITCVNGRQMEPTRRWHHLTMHSKISFHPVNFMVTYHSLYNNIFTYGMNKCITGVVSMLNPI